MKLFNIYSVLVAAAVAFYAGRVSAPVPKLTGPSFSHYDISDSYELLLPVTYKVAKKIMAQEKPTLGLIGAGNALDHTSEYQQYPCVVFYSGAQPHEIGWLRYGKDNNVEPKDSDTVLLLAWGPDHH